MQTKLLTLLITLTLPLFMVSRGQDGGQAETGGAATGGQSAQATFAFQELGQQVYSNSCAACHQASGEGIQGVYPSLVGSALVTGAPEGVIDILLNGRGGMPSFANDLSDEQIAAVISYTRNAWGNEAEPVTPEMVAGAGGESEQEEGSSTSRPGAAD